MLKVEDHQSAPAQPTHGYALSDMTDVAAAGPYVVDAAREKLVVRTYDMNGNERGQPPSTTERNTKNDIQIRFDLLQRFSMSYDIQ